MKKCVFNKKGDKMLFESGWKLFDKQTNCICPGNCVLNTQISSYIRAWGNTSCNGLTFPEGHLMEFDLKQFEGYRIPAPVLEIIRDKERKESVILYMFFTTDRMGTIEPFGWALTSRKDKLLAAHTVYIRDKHLAKREGALKEAIKYITK